jgi:outer membrane protein assembly factor BamB
VAGVSWLGGLPVAEGADWPQFRGPNRTGVSSDNDLLGEWPEDGPPLVWESDSVGRGYSSVSIVDGRLYTLGDHLTEDDPAEYLVCLSADDGRLVWKTQLGEPWDQGSPDWQGSRSTPTVDGDGVYVLTPRGDLIAANTADGSVRWRKNLREDLGGNKADGWGYSESVLVDGPRLVCTPGGEENTMVALDKQTGDVIWSVSRSEDRGAGHASIVPSEIGGTRVYVQLTGSGPMGVRASDGELLWTYDIEDKTAVIPTPIVRDDLVFFTVGYGLGGALLRQVPADDGKVNVEEVYPVNRELDNKHGGVILVGDYLYGDSSDRGTPQCAELMTGQRQWRSRASGSGSASMTAADGHLYIHFADGTMVLAEANPEEYTEISSFEIPGTGERPSWSHPVVLEGRLYLREHHRVLCYDLRGGGR